MRTVSLAESKSSLGALIEQVVDSHEPVLIGNGRHSAVLVSEEDWRGIQATLWLLSIPGMRESIKEGL